MHPPTSLVSSVGTSATTTSSVHVPAATISVHPVPSAASPPTQPTTSALGAGEIVSMNVQSNLPQPIASGTASIRTSPPKSSPALSITTTPSPAPSPVSSVGTASNSDILPRTATSGLVMSGTVSATTAGASLLVDPLPTGHLSTSFVTSSAVRVASITSTMVPPTGSLVTPPIGQSFAVPTTSSVATTTTSSTLRDPMSRVRTEIPLTGSGDMREGVVVVGSVGTSEDKQQPQPIPSSGALKRKRRDNDGEEDEDESQEPWSSLEPPSSKKRHTIRLRQRVHVSASSFTAPDTQGTSMEGAVRKVCVCVCVYIHVCTTYYVPRTY